MNDFSLINHLKDTKVQKIRGKDYTLKEIVMQNFQTGIDEQKFWYQYKFRHYSISYIYLKDFISATGMVILFQYINFNYLHLFSR
jgi:hypothetical protein